MEMGSLAEAVLLPLGLEADIETVSVLTFFGSWGYGIVDCSVSLHKGLIDDVIFHPSCFKKRTGTKLRC